MTPLAIYILFGGAVFISAALGAISMLANRMVLNRLQAHSDAEALANARRVEKWQYTLVPNVHPDQQVDPLDYWEDYVRRGGRPRQSMLVNEAHLESRLSDHDRRLTLLLHHLNLTIVGPTDQPALPMRVMQTPAIVMPKDLASKGKA